VRRLEPSPGRRAAVAAAESLVALDESLQGGLG
jgi:hypothetical protein